MKLLPNTCRLFVLLIAAALCSAARAQIFNCYEGQGVLENAWNDDSWCSDNLQSTAYVYSGSYSVQATYTAAWQAFSLETTSFPAGYFSALTFVINGGASSGRSISVSLDVNGTTSNSVNLNNYIQGGSVAANSWRQVTIPLSAFGLQPTDVITEFALQDSSGHAQPSYYIDQIKWTPMAPPKPVIISVEGASSGRTVGHWYSLNSAI